MQRNQSSGTGNRALQRAWTLFRAGKFDQAIDAADQARRHGAPPVQVSYVRADSQLHLGQLEDALATVEAAMTAAPGDSSLKGLAGVIQSRRGKLPIARPLLEEALQHEPDGKPLLYAYGAVLNGLMEHHKARQVYERLISLDEQEYLAYANLGCELRSMGDTRGALRAFQIARDGNPHIHTNRSNLLLTLLCDETMTAEALRAEAEDFSRQLATDAIPVTAPLGNSTPRIRIGIVSADLRWHACAYFLIPLIANIDRSHFDVYLFSMHQRSDKMTEKIAQYANRFVDVSGLPDAEVARRIRAEGIDVVIDLGGHAGQSPLPILVHRVAPVQMTWLGYPGTTGMKEIHYRISDWAGDPAGSEGHYTETLLRAPIFCVYHPHVSSPLQVYEDKYRVRDTPALENGHITFGSCNNLTKVSDQTLKLWSAVMARCPGSRLLVEAPDVSSDHVRLPLEARMTAHGIDIARVEFLPRAGTNQYITYNRIDIALDTAPYTGGTTTCDALWMGVPVVTLAGKAFHQRISVPFLSVTGLDFLACPDEATYVDMACELASDVGRLNELRLSLRARTESSPMCDAPAFAAWFEAQAYALSRERKGLPETLPAREQGVYFGGTWYTTTDMALSVVAHIHAREFTGLRNVLENLSSTWYRHWMVTYGLAELKYHTGSRDEAIELLIEAIGQRPYALPLYRLLAAWLDENQYDKSALAGLLADQFGLDLATLEASPVPTAFEVAGMQVQTESSKEETVA